MSLPIGEPLANDTLHDPSGTLYVIYAEPDTIAIPEIKLRQLAVQMLLTAMLIDALHSALEDRIVALDRISVDVAVADIFVGAVLDGFVAGEPLTDVLVVTSLIGHQRGFAGDVIADDIVNLPDASVVDVKATRTTAALYESKNSVLMSPTAAALFLAFDVANKGFVCFYGLANAAHRSHADNAHGFADAMRHEPRGFKSNTQHARKLIARNSFFGRAKQIHRLQPQMHGDVAVLENRSHLHSELLAALVALVEADAGRFAIHLADAIKPAAMRANRTVRPHAGFNPCESDSLVLEDFPRQNRLSHDTDFPLMNQCCHWEMGLSTTISPS
jgi:hypothetical protein